MIKKPNTNKIYVKDNYLYATKQAKKIWYPAEIKERLSVQFTAVYKKNKKDKKLNHGYYFYRDKDHTWKNKDEKI